MNKEELEQKFEEIYENVLKPKFAEIEQSRLEILGPYKKYKKLFVIFVLAAIIDMFIFMLPVLPFFAGKNYSFPINSIIFIFVFVLLIIFAVINGIKMKKISDPFKKKLKNLILIPIFNIFGEFNISEQEILTLKDIHEIGIFNESTIKKNDDKIVGMYKNINIALEETELSHIEKREKNESVQIIDFKGLIYKIKMNKNFNCKVIASERGAVSKNNLEEVVLEDVEFNRKYRILSNDQVEARYLLTLSFMERIKNIKEVFYASFINFVFENEYLYLFLNNGLNMNKTRGGLFEVGDIETPIMNKENYKKVFNELYSLFSLIDYFKLDQKTGL